MNIEIASMRIARDTNNAENSIAEAIIAQARLFSTLVEARRDTERPALTGHAELLRLHKSQASLLASASDLARLHAGLLRLQEAETGFDECPGGGRTNGADDTDPVQLRA